MRLALHESTRDCGEAAATTGLIGCNAKAMIAGPESVSGVSSLTAD